MKYYCTRQHAGPLTKECRSMRPRMSDSDDAWTRSEKAKILRSPHSAVCRSPTDRLELRLALFGFHGVMYTLTFAPDKLPSNFAGVRRALRAFFARARRARGNKSFDYVYIIEGQHGQHRFHVHLVLSDTDFTRADVESLWRQGIVHAEPVLRDSGGFRRLARYLNKEKADGLMIPVGRHPWSASRTLSAKLPPVERWKDDSPVIPVPPSAVWQASADIVNDFGEHHFRSWIDAPHTYSCNLVEN